MDLCITKAREAGVCVAVVRRSNHYGIAGYYPLLAVEHDMIGVCSTTAGTLVVPTGGRDALLGTNPIAFAAPARRGWPFMLDMATSVVPLGKIEVKARRGEPLPPGWAVDAQGQTAVDAQAVLDHLHSPPVGGVLAPLGGLEAGHKGYGLAVMVDILSGLLAGARASIHLSEGMRLGEAADLGHLVAAMDIAAFAEVDAFKQAMDDYIGTLHAAPPAGGVERVRVAGDPEFEAEQRRRREGIPLHQSVWESLRRLGKVFGVLLPAGN